MYICGTLYIINISSSFFMEQLEFTTFDYSCSIYVINVTYVYYMLCVLFKHRFSFTLLAIPAYSKINVIIPKKYTCHEI